MKLSVKPKKEVKRLIYRRKKSLDTRCPFKNFVFLNCFLLDSGILNELFPLVFVCLMRGLSAVREDIFGSFRWI